MTESELYDRIRKSKWYKDKNPRVDITPQLIGDGIETIHFFDDRGNKVSVSKSIFGKWLLECSSLERGLSMSIGIQMDPKSSDDFTSDNILLFLQMFI